VLSACRPQGPGRRTVTVDATVDHRGRLVRVASARILDADGKTAALARASAMVVPDGIRRLLRGEFLQAPTFYQ
jgi:acyl-coenzyme A thioesterase PaaI-like protein